MKKWICLLEAIICCMLFSVTPKADVLFEPDDSFYHAHASDCTYVGRQYIANGPDGKVIVYESPQSPEAVDTWQNGQQETIYFTYDQEGVAWGVGQDGGWVPMEYLQVVYDNISFMEEHETEIKSQSGSLESLPKGTQIYFWKYPGSQVTYEGSIEDNPISYDKVYADSEGKNWGYINYYYGHREVWVCIDQPEADYEQLYPQGNGEDERSSEGQADSSQHTEDDTQRIEPKRDYTMVLWAAALVIAVAAVTVFLLVLLKKKAGK